jgi:hypothetical protein
MYRFGLTAIIALSATLSFTAPVAQAQSSRAVEPPAEFPPESYQGRQYVDSRGCVYVRAGVDGAVNWVPRVTRDRQMICGQTPSLAEPAAPVVAARPAPVVIEDPTPVRAKQRPVRMVPKRSGVAAPKTAPTPKDVRRTELRIVPKHVYKQQKRVVSTVPKGYKPAFDDDRLNPHRAHMTPNGYRATQQVLTNEVPRRALNGSQPIKKHKIVGRGPGLGH